MQFYHLFFFFCVDSGKILSKRFYNRKIFFQKCSITNSLKSYFYTSPWIYNLVVFQWSPTIFLLFFNLVFRCAKLFREKTVLDIYHFRCRTRLTKLVNIYIYTYICLCVCVCVYVCLCVCVCVCMRYSTTHTHTHTHTHIYIYNVIDEPILNGCICLNMSWIVNKEAMT